jgi:hypothetical protein
MAWRARHEDEPEQVAIPMGKGQVCSERGSSIRRRPAVYHVLNSKERPRFFTRSFRTEKEDYDSARLGLRITVLHKRPDPDLPAIERRRIYDTTLPSQGNSGHRFGDHLTEDERIAVIEYLKTF